MTPLRFGVMAFGLKLAAWEARCVTLLVQERLAEPCLLIVDPANEMELPPNPPLKRLRTLARSSNAFWLAYERMMEPHIEALRPVDIPGELRSVEKIICPVIKKGKFSEYFEKDDVARIQEKKLDFILRFAYGIIRGDILQAARYGVWSLHHGDEESYRGGPPGFWEIFAGERRTGAVLQRLTERLDGGVVLKKGTFPTVFSSWPRSRDLALWGSSVWPAEVCRDILVAKAEYLHAKPSRTTAPVFHNPTNAQLIRYLGRALWFAATRSRPARKAGSSKPL